MRRVCAVTLLAGAILGGPAPLLAKGRTARISLTCTALGAPIAVTDSLALNFRYGPWGGGFLDSARREADPAPDGRPFCQVAFYVDRGAPHPQLAYVLYYYPGGSGQPGRIFLPGRGSVWYALNVRTILRSGRDGRWSYAAPAWESVIRPVIQRAEAATRASRT